MQTKINLLPWREELKIINKRNFFCYLFGSLFLTFIMSIVLSIVLSSMINSEILITKIMEDKICILNKSITRINNMEQIRNLIIKQINIIKEKHKKQSNISNLLYALSSIMPEEIILLNLKFNSGKITIVGKALENPSIIKFINGIKNTNILGNPILSEVKNDIRHNEQNFIVHTFIK